MIDAKSYSVYFNSFIEVFKPFLNQQSTSDTKKFIIESFFIVLNTLLLLLQKNNLTLKVMHSDTSAFLLELYNAIGTLF